MCLPVKINTVKPAEPSHDDSEKSLFSDDSMPTFTVPTFREKPEESIEIQDLSPSQISSLKRKDPFMYYSIPAARRCAMRGKDLDTSLLTQDASSSCSSSGDLSSRKSRKVTLKVTKQRRFSMEMHPDALMEEMLNDSQFMSTVSNISIAETNDDDDLGDLLYSMFDGMTK
jgi:hypothetical protein